MARWDVFLGSLSSERIPAIAYETSSEAQGYLSRSFEDTGALPYGGTRFQLMGWGCSRDEGASLVAGGGIALFS